MYNDSCYVLLHRDRSANKDRTRNLLQVIKHIKSNIDIPIFVLEQDKEPDYDLVQQLLGKHIMYQFLYNPGLFNRSWGYNCAAKLVRCNKLILADNDVIIDIENLKIGLNLLSNFDIIKPFKKLYDLTDEETTHYFNDGVLPSSFGKPRANLTAGTLLMITRAAFLKVGGYDERFEGWGGEDDEMTIHLWNFINNKDLTYYMFGDKLIHLYHSRTDYDTFNQPNYKNNYKYIKDNINRNENIIIGQLDKYSQTKTPTIKCISFKAYHNHWSGDFTLYDNHTFKGGGIQPNGTWHIEGETNNLVLKWYHWPEEILEPKPNGYVNNTLKLVFSCINK